MVMLTYQTLDMVASHKAKNMYKINQQTTNKNFYCKPFSTHSNYFDQINKHKNFWNFLISVDMAWGTKYCPNQVHTFINAITEVNTWKARDVFQKGIDLL